MSLRCAAQAFDFYHAERRHAALKTFTTIVSSERGPPSRVPAGTSWTRLVLPTTRLWTRHRRHNDDFDRDLQAASKWLRWPQSGFDLTPPRPGHLAFQPAIKNRPWHNKQLPNHKARTRTSLTQTGASPALGSLKAPRAGGGAHRGPSRPASMEPRRGLDATCIQMCTTCYTHRGPSRPASMEPRRGLDATCIQICTMCDTIEAHRGSRGLGTL